MFGWDKCFNLFHKLLVLRQLLRVLEHVLPQPLLAHVLRASFHAVDAHGDAVEFLDDGVVLVDEGPGVRGIFGGCGGYCWGS